MNSIHERREILHSDLRMVLAEAQRITDAGFDLPTEPVQTTGARPIRNIG